MSDLAKARRRIRQLEKCLDGVLSILADNFIDLNGHGADDPGNATFRLNEAITRRITRTLKPTRLTTHRKSL